MSYPREWGRFGMRGQQQQIEGREDIASELIPELLRNMETAGGRVVLLVARQHRRGQCPLGQGAQHPRQAPAAPLDAALCGLGRPLTRHSPSASRRRARPPGARRLIAEKQRPGYSRRQVIIAPVLPHHFRAHSPAGCCSERKSPTASDRKSAIYNGSRRCRPAG